MLGEGMSSAAEAKAGDFESIEKAVMESRRGRWFLDEYARRRSGGETKILLSAIGKLETAIASNHDMIAERLSKALGLAVTPPPTELSPQHMKFFKQDEDLFEAPVKPAEVPRAPQPTPEAVKGAKLVIRRPHAENQSEAPHSEINLAPEISAAEAPAKNRIVIIRHKVDERVDVPLHDEMRASG